MKTTKNTALLAKIEKFIKSKDVSKNSIVYGWLIAITEGDTEFRPVYTQGSTWKHSSLIDKTAEFTRVLKQLGLTYSLTNDAPRGGKTGALITIITKVKA